jgi:glycosyltransferase involved in cell wall biosynthesis
MERYAGMLRDLLTGHGWRVDLIRPEPFFGRLRRSAHGLGKWLGYLDKFILFPLALRRRITLEKAQRQPFVVHICDHSNAIYTRWLGDVPHLVTCHDLLAIESALGLIPEHRTGWTGRILQHWILSGLRRAARVICVSQETRKRLLELAPNLADRSSVIENALNFPYAPMSVDEAKAALSALAGEQPFQPGEDRYLLHVGGNAWYKNREGVLRILGEVHAHARCPIKLVLAGKPPTPTLRHLVEKLGLTQRVIFVGTVSDEQLRALYSMAEALVFPSWREGFGWPMIEAQACGCLVVTSDRAPMNQIAGPAALLADPNDPAEFARRIEELGSESPELHRRRRAEALRHAGKFRPEHFLWQILQIYEAVAKSG